MYEYGTVDECDAVLLVFFIRLLLLCVIHRDHHTLVTIDRIDRVLKREAQKSFNEPDENASPRGRPNSVGAGWAGNTPRVGISDDPTSLPAMRYAIRSS